MNTCKSCGISIPDGQPVCSMCYGDPDYGKDGYYQAELDSERRELEGQAQQIEQEERHD